MTKKRNLDLPEVFEEFSFLREFDRDLKNLLKRYGTLNGDLERFIKHHLYVFHKTEKQVTGTHQLTYIDPEDIKVFKTKKFACRALSGTGSRSGIRVIHAYYPEKNRIEFAEIYYKGDKKNEDRERITNYYE